MEYNTNRGDLQYREYGRNVKKMVEYVCGMEEGEKKEQAVKSLVTMMAMVSGMSLRDDVSYHKLWDHLMILSQFRLESMWPFGDEELQALKQRMEKTDNVTRERLKYSSGNVRHRHYGAYLEAMLKKMKEMPEGTEYDTLSTMVAQQAKRSYLVWNGELADDNIVVHQMSAMYDDNRLEEHLKDKGINVPAATLPVESKQNGKKRKKKK